MSAKGMGDINELVAEIANEKAAKTLSNTSEIDNILKRFGKSDLSKGGAHSPDTPGLIAPPSTTADEIKPSSSVFDSFFHNNFSDIVSQEDISSNSSTTADKKAQTANIPEPDTALPNKKAVSRFSGEQFAETFAIKQEPQTKADKKNRDKAFSKPAKEQKAANDLAQELQIDKAELPFTEQAVSQEPFVRKVETAPSAGSLRGKLLSAAQSSAFSTEEDEEYPVPAPDEPIAQQESAIEKAYNEFAGQGEADAPEIPTVEFPAQGAKAIKPATVLRPSADGASTVYDKIRRTQSIMNNEVDETFREFFGETVAVSRAEIEEGLRPKAKGSLLGRLFAKQLPELDEDAPDDAEEDLAIDDSTDDYNAPSDAPAVESTLASLRVSATLRVAATALTSLLLLYLGLSARTGLLPAIPMLDPANEPLLYLVANAVLLLIAGIVCFSTIVGGFVSLFKEPSGDILTALCFTGSFLQSIAYLVSADVFDPAKATLFAPVAAIALCASALGKRMQCVTVCRNFETVSVGYDHSAAFLLKNREVAAKVCRELEPEEPALLVSRHTALVKGFLSQSFSQCKNAYAARILSFVIMGFGVLAFIITMVQSNSFFSALSAFAAICALCSPFSATLIQAVPAALMQKSTTRVGAVVAGWSAIEALGAANTVLINAKDLFPRESIRLHGIKTFEKERIDLAILYAASILVEGCDTLRDIFLGVIENKTEMLYKVDSLSVEPGLGFTAWVEHTRVIVGNRLIMQKHDIALPSLDYEMKYTKGERSPIYLAVSGKLFGMFLVSYSPTQEVDDELYTLTHSGMSIVIKSDDFNLTSDMVAQLYQLNRSQVKVLNAQERDALAPLTAYLPESDGILTHLGTLSSFSGGIRAACAAQSGLRLAGIVQIAAVALGILLCALLIMSKSLVAISLTAVLLFQLAWTALTVIVPYTRRY